MKRVGVGDVIDDDGDGRVSNVGRDETPEPLLTGRVPQLQPDRSVLQVHRLGEEVDADGVDVARQELLQIGFIIGESQKS